MSMEGGTAVTRMDLALKGQHDFHTGWTHYHLLQSPLPPVAFHPMHFIYSHFC